MPARCSKSPAGQAGCGSEIFKRGGGVGTLRVLDGGAFTTPGGVGTVLGLGSSIVVQRNGWRRATGSRFIVPTQLQMTGARALLVEDGAEARVEGLLLDGNSTVQILDGATLSSFGGGDSAPMLSPTSNVKCGGARRGLSLDVHPDQLHPAHRQWRGGDRQS